MTCNCLSRLLQKHTKCMDNVLKCQIHTKTSTQPFPIFSNMADFHLVTSRANTLYKKKSNKTTSKFTPLFTYKEQLEMSYFFTLHIRYQINDVNACQDEIIVVVVFTSHGPAEIGPIILEKVVWRGITGLRGTNALYSFLCLYIALCSFL